MSADTPRPWWATAAGDDDLDDRDPLDAHRRARRGPDGRPSPEDAADAPPPGHEPDVCGVCPWCTGMRLLAASHPEAVTHLTEAARHLTQAVRSLVADMQWPGDDPDTPPDDEPFERIDLD